MRERSSRILRLFVCGLLCAGITCCTAWAVAEDVSGIFPDVPADADYAEAVETLYQQGILTGDEKGNFNPDNRITRAEAAAILCRLTGVEDEAKRIKDSVFTDVPSSHWAVGYVTRAQQLGIIGGYGNGRFGPSDPVTYEQIVKMLVCAWGYEEDAKLAGGWPQGYLSVADELGIGSNYQGDTSLPAARKTVADLCYDMLFVYENIK